MTTILATRRLLLPAATLSLTALLVGCTSGESTSSPATADATATTATTATSAAKEPVEVRVAHQRLAVSHDGGVTIVDVTPGSEPRELTTVDAEGYLRLNPAGDDRHVFVSTAEGFQVLDMGAWSEGHDDHFHHYAGDPALTDRVIKASKPGHVVAGEGHVVLFDDGTGEVTTLDTAATDLPVTSAFTLTPHHGIAVPSGHDYLVTTVGDDGKTRTGIAVVDVNGKELQAFHECPGTHGAAEAHNAVLFGCTDGALIWKNGATSKVAAPDAYGRIGNQASVPSSPIVLGDYKVDKDADLERPTRVTLIDTRTGDLKLVELGTSYTFRSLGMSESGTPVVLGTDGSLHILDAESGTVARTIPVLGEWEESLEWQDPRPTLLIDGETAYVTDSATKELFVIDLQSGETTATLTLSHVPDEVTGA
ncbi:hypothetical protein CATRI_02360 [Corynebacterium atrinae]|uniref:hypothetical protein n=1 Tax=Corynebacterium atrinae TaxID=1336740 RepID=UPI0025B401D4|nr:hypothetical protein [Corynebacterium atrinae]WJY62577.1 hypothetical protein CATRI_02360 [Corynebacterium atrinae]